MLHQHSLNTHQTSHGGFFLHELQGWGKDLHGRGEANVKCSDGLGEREKGWGGSYEELATHLCNSYTSIISLTLPLTL